MRLLPAVTAALLVGHAVAAQQPRVMTWNINGLDRQALVFAPPAQPGNGVSPVVLVFHGHGGTMRSMAANVHFQTAWPQAVTVYLQGLPTVRTKSDPEGLKSGWQTELGEDGDRDVKFVDEVVATLRAKFAIDDKRIFAIGFSNGAFFTYVLWGSRANVFAGFAAVAGRMSPGVRPATPRPLLQITGRADPLVKFDDQKATVDQARKIDSALGTGAPCGPTCTLFSSSQNAPVEWFTHPGGHVVPPETTQLAIKFFRMVAAGQ